jgi:hypothetical protein
MTKLRPALFGSRSSGLSAKELDANAARFACAFSQRDLSPFANYRRAAACLDSGCNSG